MAAHRKGVLEFDGVQVKPSSDLLTFLKDVCQSDEYAESLKKQVRRVLDKHPVRVPFKTLKCVRDAARKASQPPVYLHELLERSELCLPNPVTPPRNPELELRIQKLKAQQMNREYDRMTANVDRCRKSVGTAAATSSAVGAEIREVKKQSLAVVNLLLSIGGTFAFFYKAVEYSLPEPHIAAQVLAGLFAAIVVAVAELYFVIKVI
ncbi:transmembrane protein 199 [Ixodes scapularis]|nr:transmembrane protein 199 [Ixodes scapularis]